MQFFVTSFLALILHPLRRTFQPHINLHLFGWRRVQLLLAVINRKQVAFSTKVQGSDTRMLHIDLQLVNN
jgi:hypothetical protein